MWDRIRGGRSQVRQQHTEGSISWPARRLSRQPSLEVLEDRRLLTATLQSISNMTVPAQQGAVVALLAQSTTTDAQTFKVTSSNPDIAASIVQGPFWTVGVSYTDPNTSNSFAGSLTFQLFQNFTPNTVNMITQFTNDNYYVSSGKYFPRIVSNFGGTGNYVVQGGAATLDGSGSSGQTGTPYPNENLQQLTLSGTNELALANSGGTDSNDTQFFINTGQVSQLDYGYTIFGQMLTGQTTLGQMTQIPVMANTSSGEVSQPVNPLTITRTTLTTTNPNGVLVVDASQAKSGETAVITVTATDPTDGTTAVQSFTVTINAYAGPATPTINFKPFANVTTASVAENGSQQVQLNGASGYPVTSNPGTLSYSLLSQPTHGTVTNFNASTGTFTYTPASNYLGPDTLQYKVTSTGPQTTLPTTLTSNAGTVTINVGATNTGAVNLIGTALVVTPLPRSDHGTNKIEVSEVAQASAAGGSVIQVNVNGELDAIQPGINTVNRIIVFGGKHANNDIIIDPSVTLPTTIDGGRGRINYLTGGGGTTREHGWFGSTTLIGGPGTNQLIGLAGHVRFKPSKATNVIYAGVPHRRTHLLHPVPPSGTFYKFVHGRLVPVKTV
ncbi:MAG: peptidylprolyl isomerase [Isosphaerales bacterium]